MKRGIKRAPIPCMVWLLLLESGLGESSRACCHLPFGCRGERASAVLPTIACLWAAFGVLRWSGERERGMAGLERG